jgi:acetate---CoA ligase (ADP-forming)
VPELEALLRARSVAVVGASPRRESFGWHVLRQLIDFGFSGRIVPINPGYDTVEGFACYPSVGAVPGSVDCAAICLKDERIEAALIDAVGAGVRAAVVFGVAAGSAADGGSLRERIGAIAREADVALMGANCMGFFNFADRLFLTGYPYHREPSCGAISFITHSGSTLSAVAKNTRGMTFNYVISPGQELVLTAADYLDFVLRQSETRVVGLFIETIRDPARFLAALELANQRDIPVVMLKVGRSEQGARMAMAHTGALAGAQAAIEALASRYGVSLVRTMEEMLDTLELFASGRRPTAPGLGAITDSGGERGMLVDLAADAGVSFAHVSPETIQVLAKNLDPGLEPGNPADLWGSGRDWQHTYRTCIGAMLADEAIGAFNFGIDFNIGSRLGPDYRAIAIEAFRSTTKPFAVVSNVAAGLNPDDAAALRSVGVPVLEGTETGLRALRHLFMCAEHRSTTTSLMQGSVTLSKDAIQLVRSNRALTEGESLSVLGELGMPAVTFRCARDEHSAIEAARAIGFPAVMKTAVPGLLHKSDAGGVRLGIRDERELREAWQAMSARLGPDVLIQPQLDTSQGVELVLGMGHDPQFGPMVTVGLGGVWVEALRDFITFLAPCSAGEVSRRLRSLRGYDVLRGARGRIAVDIEALARVVEQFSLAVLALSPWVAEIDVNPLMAVGDQFTMLDALIVPFTAATGATSTG